MKHGLVFLASLALDALACGGRTPLATVGCFELAPTCVQLGGPCGEAASVDPVCDVATRHWSCPAGATTYARAADAPGVCLPFHDQGGPIQSMRGSLPRVPLDDGRCLWIGEAVTTTDGASLWNVGFLVAPSATFGGCPTIASVGGGAPSSVVAMDGPSDPSLVVQIAGGYRLGGRTRVLYRLFQTDPSAEFGLTLLGAGLARWDAARGMIVVPPRSALLWDPGLDLGDASLVEGDTAYVWGCHSPFHQLTDDCVVARLDDQDAVQLYGGQGQWLPTLNAPDGAVVFGSASWFSSVVPFAGSLEHVYVEAWGFSLQVHTAPAPEGPWVDAADLAPCDLPGDDGHAYCSGAVVHAELQDPTRPGEQVLSYSNGTLATDQSARYAAHPDEYWPRLVRVGK